MNSLIHPALWQLTKMRTAGRFNRILANLRQPRKLAVTILGTVLALVWLSNVIASLLFRETYDPESLRTWMTLSLSLYAGWHFVRVAWQRPGSAIEWTAAEQNNLVPSPFSREELVQYRLATVLGSTTLKAAIGTLLLLPDLTYPLLGFVALWCGLAFVELIRLIADTFSSGLNLKLYRVFQLLLVVGLVAAGIALASTALLKTQSTAAESKIPVVFQFGMNFFELLRSSVDTTWGEILTAPFGLIVALITTSVITFEILLTVLAAFSILIVATWSLLRLDSWSESEIVKREKSKRDLLVCKNTIINDVSKRKTSSFPGLQIKACGGAVTWRQCVGVYRYGTGVFLALIPPAILSAMPLFMPRLNDRAAILNFLGGLIFYSFLLLPSALKFDFRRDYSHLLLLKMLPLKPSRILLGQIATPIIITTCFQYAMLGLACFLREFNSTILICAICSFPVMNLAVYSWENLMFLLFPQKLKQEGIEVFLRTTILFTAKGVACGIVFALMFAWAMLSARLSLSLRGSIPLVENHRIVFAAGVWISVTTVALILIWQAARQFQNLDVFPESQSG